MELDLKKTLTQKKMQNKDLLLEECQIEIRTMTQGTTRVEINGKPAVTKR